MLIWIISAVVFVIAMTLILGYPRVHPPRKASFEGIENPEAVQAYDRISRWPQFKFIRRMIVRETKNYHPEGLLVDVGCGPGYLLALLAFSYPHLNIIGVDIAEEMLQEASGNLDPLGFGERVKFRQGDAKQLPFEDNTVDFVVSTLSLHHWLDPKQALLEIHRILKPGGQFLIFDLRRDGRRFVYWIIGFATAFVVPAPMRRIKEPLGSALSSYTPVEAEAFLSETPFQQRRVKPGFGWLFIWGRKAAGGLEARA
jgi:ubiquinone/menaquinone biosynthesis C-methylase UbiE